MKGEIISEEILSNRWGKYAEYKVRYTRNDGTVHIQDREVHDTGDGATILLYNTKKKTVVLIRQYRVASQLNGNDNGFLIEAVAGLVEEGESHEDTIIREALEETGLKANDVKYLFSAFATPGAKTEKIHFYIGSYDQEVRKNDLHGLLDEDEEIEVLELPFDEAYNAIFSGEIEDAKTIILLQYLRLHIFST